MLPIYNVSLKNIFEEQGCIKARKRINLLLLYLQAKKNRISRTNIVVCHQEMARLMMEQ